MNSYYRALVGFPVTVVNNRCQIQRRTLLMCIKTAQNAPLSYDEAE